MHLCAITLAIVALLTVLISAFPTDGHEKGHGNDHQCHLGKPPLESSRCYTKIASTRGNRKPETHWTTHWPPCTVTATCTTTKTVTPRSTVTRTRTVTRLKASTVPAPASFTPVQSSLPGSSYSGSGGPDPIHKREISGVSPNSGSSRSLVFGPRYPQEYSCQKWTPTKCHTISTTITSTVIEHTSTRHVTTTTTKTSYKITTTVYAACATDNLADMYKGTPIGEVTGGFSTVFDTNATTAYDCCVAAVTMADTSVWAFEPNPFPDEGANCFIGQTDGSCPAPATNPSTAESGIGDLTVGNSDCGVINADVPFIIVSSSSSAPVKRWVPAPTSL